MLNLSVNHYLSKQKFQFVSDALNATNGFITGDYLDRYPRESTDKFQRRKDVAWYSNDLKPACLRFASYLFKESATRRVTNPLVTKFLDDCDWRENSIDIFLQNFTIEAKARGCMLLLVDMPSKKPTDKASQDEQRFFPYLVSIPPEKVYSYTLNEKGLFNSIQVESHGIINGYTRFLIRGWDTKSWWVTDGVSDIDRGEHNLGVCPVLAFSEGMQFPYTGDFSQIANISKRLYNMRSELDEILRSQTFSLLTYQVPPSEAGSVNPSQVAEAIGTHNLLIHPAATPVFVAPPEGPAKTYMDAITKLEQLSKEIGMDTSVTVNSRYGESGAALVMRFQTLNASLLAFARRMEDLERRVFDLVSLWLGIENNNTTSWPKDFNVSDALQEIQVLKDMQACAFPQQVITEKMKCIVQQQFSNMEAAELDALLASCDEPLLGTNMLTAVDGITPINPITPSTLNGEAGGM